MKANSPIPRSTYRLQLNHEFTFNQATAIVPYLSALGISHSYVSPCLKARAGSMHGYDIVDHNSLNPEIGTPEDFDRFVETLHSHDMGLILDIVPNHMGIMGGDNAWWLDVLENGEASIYAGFFDIDWHSAKEELVGKVLVPALHDHYGAVLESGELKLVFHPERGEFDICYRTHRFPIDPKQYPQILQPCAEELSAVYKENPDFLEFQSLIAAFGHLPARQEVGSARVAERNRDKEILKRRLMDLCKRLPEICSCITRRVNSINGKPEDPTSFERLHEIIKAQAFRLANWRVAADDINYRRFFDTNDLAGLRTENETVFRATHGFVLDLMAEGKVDGFRIDHPDGLYDPAQYFERLHRSIVEVTSHNGTEKAAPRFVAIEKILTGAERLPAEWPISGTTGYDFANLVNGLFVDPSNELRLTRLYESFIGDEVVVDDLEYRCRKLIIRVALASELTVLASKLTRIALSKRRTCDFTLNSLRDALTEVAASFPVYRTYVSPKGVSETDERYVKEAVAEAKRRSPAADSTIFDFVEKVLLTHIADGQDPVYRSTVTNFAMKFQQFTSPVMAKGLEDTAFYRFNRLLSLIGVGADLHRFGISVDEFHAANEERLKQWPQTMLATSTHDSKRSEDIRARINILSEIPEVWKVRVHHWRRYNLGLKRKVADKPAPTPNDEYLLYQTLVGAWPLTSLDDEDAREDFIKRIEEYMLKAIREAKQNTSWINRNGEYEEAMSSFVKSVIKSRRFLDDFLPFQEMISRLGMWNSLAQTLLKLTCPGVPDIYQGNELWEFNLVDPDNRRPVDYEARQQLFQTLRSCPDCRSARRLLETAADGRIKMHTISRTLCLRARHSHLFERGEYIPIRVEGSKAENVFAFARRSQGSTAIVVVPRLIAGLLDYREVAPIGEEIWQDTRLILPFVDAPAKYRNVFTEEELEVSNDAGASMPVSRVLQNFPVAVYEAVAA